MCSGAYELYVLWVNRYTGKQRNLRNIRRDEVNDFFSDSGSSRCRRSVTSRCRSVYCSYFLIAICYDLIGYEIDECENRVTKMSQVIQRSNVFLRTVIGSDRRSEQTELVQ